jgi:hypothetical protein
MNTFVLAPSFFNGCFKARRRDGLVLSTNELVCPVATADLLIRREIDLS